MPDEHDDERDATRVQSRAKSLTADESEAGSDIRTLRPKQSSRSLTPGLWGLAAWKASRVRAV